jgi:hypothetical protein
MDGLLMRFCRVGGRGPGFRGEDFLSRLRFELRLGCVL